VKSNRMVLLVIGVIVALGMSFAVGYFALGQEAERELLASSPNTMASASSPETDAPTQIVIATPCDTCPDKGQPAATDTPMPSLPIAPVPGAQAPDFTLTDLNGDVVTLGELRGQVVLLNFWATW
jgi:cytochrome oxidase Cu insertion factor (SCO1/SenC/PrrC family)